MQNHRAFIAEEIVEMDLFTNKLVPEEKLKDAILNKLSMDIAESIIQNPDLFSFSTSEDKSIDGLRYKIEIVVINPTKYKELKRIIEKIDLEIYDEKYGQIRLRDFL